MKSTFFSENRTKYDKRLSKEERDDAFLNDCRSKIENNEEKRKEFCESIGKRIDEERQKKGISKVLLGTAIGIKRHAVMNYCKGDLPGLERIFKLCDALGCDINYLFGVIDKPTITLQGIYNETGLVEQSVKALNETPEIANALNIILHCDKDVVREFFECLIRYICVPDIDNMDLYVRGSRITDVEEPSSYLYRVEPWEKVLSHAPTSRVKTKRSVIFAKKNKPFNDDIAVDLDVDMFQRALLDKMKDKMSVLRKQILKIFRINEIRPEDPSWRKFMTFLYNYTPKDRDATDQDDELDKQINDYLDDSSSDDDS